MHSCVRAQPSPLSNDPLPHATHACPCDQDVNATYSPGDLVSVSFVSANPRNDPRRGGSFLTVEQFVNGNWTVVYTDAHFETKYYW